MLCVIYQMNSHDICMICCMICRKNLHLSEERIAHIRELSKKEAIYERLASALGSSICL